MFVRKCAARSGRASLRCRRPSSVRGFVPWYKSDSATHVATATDCVRSGCQFCFARKAKSLLATSELSQFAPSASRSIGSICCSSGLSFNAIRTVVGSSRPMVANNQC